MSRIGIDVDGVLRDFPQDLMRVVKEHYPQYINENSDKLLHWSLSDNFNCTKEDLQQISTPYRVRGTEEGISGIYREEDDQTKTLGAGGGTRG